MRNGIPIATFGIDVCRNGLILLADEILMTNSGVTAFGRGGGVVVIAELGDRFADAGRIGANSAGGFFL